MNQSELNRESEAIRDLACKVLGWHRKDVNSFSLSAIRSFVVGLPKLSFDAKRLRDAIDNWQREWRGL